MRIGILYFAVALLLIVSCPLHGQANDPDCRNIEVRYLGSNGWAVSIGNRVLIFDYQEMSDPSPPTPSDRCLATGYIDPDELIGYDVYVFVTHSHPDHYDRAIFRWAYTLDEITYIFGWDVGVAENRICLAEWRETAELDGMTIYTIYSHHNDVPEVAYLVQVDGVVLFHNGDYCSDYRADYEYLRSIAERIDVAFVIGHAFPEHQHFQQTSYLAELFEIGCIFPMNREGQSYKCDDFAQLLAESGVDVPVLVAEVRGDVFRIER